MAARLARFGSPFDTYTDLAEGEEEGVTFLLQGIAAGPGDEPSEDLSHGDGPDPFPIFLLQRDQGGACKPWCGRWWGGTRGKEVADCRQGL